MPNPEPCEKCRRAPQRVFLPSERLFVCFHCAAEAEEEPGDVTDKVREKLDRTITPERRTT
ncbi:MAG: hypothetical protein ACOC5J_03415 [Gemmatimonadota bacterium]